MTQPLPSVQSRYDALVAAGTIEADPAQMALVAELDRLATRLGERRPRTSGVLSWLMGSRDEPPPKGFYIWGAVGRGKTMLMDLFYDSLDVAAKQRSHFHSYMADVHGRIHAWRQKLKAGEVTGDDPIRPVAAELAAEAQVLCFDEFAVTDIADAMILGRLFTAMFAEGTVVVATSNVPPSGLYKDGLNRALFVPFVRLLEERTEVFELGSRTDYRMEKLGDASVYFSPPDRAAMDALFRRMTGGAPATPATLRVLGHPVEVPLQAMGVARFRFEELCGRPLAAPDYLALARTFHTVFLDDVPRLTEERRNEARRLITLVDVFYERHVKLVVSAQAVPAELYGPGTKPESFEFARTVSRLFEMGSRDYLAASRPDATSGNATGLVET